jgi:AraC-like DNA-binding protein
MTHHTISIRHVHDILQGAQRQGHDTARLLERAGIVPWLRDVPLARVSQAQYAALLRGLRRATRDELFGLGPQPLPIGSFSTGCRLLLQARTLDEALRSGFRYYHGLLGGFVARLTVDGGSAHVRLASRMPADEALRYAQRMFLFFSFGLGSWLVARRIPLQEVQYCGKGSSDTDRVFQAPVSYGHAELGLRFDARWLALPVVQNAQSLQEFLREAPANLLVKYRDRSSVTERLRRLLRAQLHGELPSLEEVSRTLAMTPQTLRRRLCEEGRGYQTLKDELRRDAAIEHLARPDLTLEEIAARLGFSEASTFHRAFKKWTGVAPGEYRHRQRGAAGAPAALHGERWAA